MSFEEIEPLDRASHDYLLILNPSLQFAGDIPHADCHYAIGDITAWPGIKRCGGAMHMGHYCALNIHQKMLSLCRGGSPNFKTLAASPAVIGLALGKKAITYTPDEGTRYGEELSKTLFGEDMANQSTLFSATVA